MVDRGPESAGQPDQEAPSRRLDGRAVHAAGNAIDRHSEASAILVSSGPRVSGSGAQQAHPPADWDFFLAYASADVEDAQLLYELLAPRSRVFWDRAAGLTGQRFGPQLQKAQRSSRITVALVRGATFEQAVYLQDEVHRAIELTRSTDHRLVPVRLDHEPAPYGLLPFSWLNAQSPEALEAAAAHLCDLLAALAPLPRSPRFQAVADVSAVERLLEELLPSHAEALALWWQLRDAVDGHALSRDGQKKWRSVLHAFLNNHPQGLVPVLEAAWRLAPAHELFEPFLAVAREGENG